MAAIYAVYTSPSHPPIPNHLPTLIVTPHGQPSNILYSYLHTNYNTENYLLTPSPQGDLCVAKLFPPRPENQERLLHQIRAIHLLHLLASSALSLPSPDSPDLPLFQISKPNPNATFWSMFYFAYAGHNIPPKRIEFGKIQKNPPGPNGGGTRISITGKSPEEKAVWQTLGEGNEDCVEWVVLCAALNLLDDEIMKAAEKNPPPPAGNPNPSINGRPAPVSLRDPGPASNGPPPAGRPGPGPGPGQGPNPGPLPPQQRPQPPPNGSGPINPAGRPPAGYAPPNRGFPPGQGPPPAGYGPPGQGPPPAGYGPPGQGPPPAGYGPPGQGPPGGYGLPQGMGPNPAGRPGPGPGPGPRLPSGPAPPAGYGGRPPPPGQMPMPQPGPAQGQIRRF
ncbi:hypothetical protein BDZ97DRAFT_1923167 [Flammula alnicola]|nr:hypothetical protein BDZ97DRAFT_1923167 [Flammula alnicola]